MRLFLFVSIITLLVGCSISKNTSEFRELKESGEVQELRQSTIITYEGNALKVFEIDKRNWVYTLYESDEPKCYYVEVVKGSIGVYTKMYKITLEGVKKIKAPIDSEVEELAEKYSE